MRRDNFFTDNADIAFHIGKRMDYGAIWDGMTSAERESSGAGNARRSILPFGSIGSASNPTYAAGTM